MLIKKERPFVSSGDEKIIFDIGRLEMGRFKYIAKLCFDVNDEIVEHIYFDGKSKNQNGSFDAIKITNYYIEVDCNRSSNRDLSRLIVDFSSTINVQISKAVSYLASTIGSVPEIKKIELTKFDRGVQKDQFAYNPSDILQPLKNNVPSCLLLSTRSIDTIFEGTEKANVLHISLSYWLKSITEKIQGDRFDRLWTSFNCLYSFITKEKSENRKLYKMRKYITDNSFLFADSCSFFDNYDKVEIRKLQWQKLIINDFETYNMTEAFQYFILRYSDYRLNQVFEEILCYREEFLKQQGRIEDVENHIKQSILNHKKDNCELLCFYLLKYCYFVRNKFFHGEKIDPTFHLIKNDEITELELLNNILEIFLKELIEANGSY